MSSKKYNLFLTSKNRDKNEPIYNFNLYLKNQILISKNEIINVNVMSFSMLNSMYNVNSTTQNNTFTIRKTQLDGTTLINNTTITIPYGNYSVLTLRDTINSLLNTAGLNNISLTYNTPTNTYTYANTDLTKRYFLIPLNMTKLLGVSTMTEINSLTGSYVNMVNYEQIILRCPSLDYEYLNQENIRDKSSTFLSSDILFTINKGDTQPFKIISYKNEDAGTSYSYNIKNKDISVLNLQLYNENDEPIYDAPDFLLEIQFIVMERNDDYFKEISIQSLSLLDDIYYTLLNILFKKNLLSN